MNDVIIRLTKLPLYIKGQLLLDEDGDYNVYINSQYSMEMQKATFEHEINHILYNDFSGVRAVADIEEMPL